MPSLSTHNKADLTKLFKRLVRQIRPSDLNGTANNAGTFGYFADAEDKKPKHKQCENYSRALLIYMSNHPHITSGERFDDPAKTRIFLNPTLIAQNDRDWIKSAVEAAALEYRFKDGLDFKTRILKEPSGGWVTWETTDCCFAAMMHALDIPEILREVGVDNQYLATFSQGVLNKLSGDRKYYDELARALNLHDNSTQSIVLEKTLELELAGYLEIPRKAVRDETLIFLLETRLNWTRLNAKTLEQVAGEAENGNTYIISYCADVTTDFWHIIHAKRAGTSWVITDRQKARKGQVEKLPSIVTNPADAWEINTNSTLFREVRTKFVERFTLLKQQLDNARAKAKV